MTLPSGPWCGWGNGAAGEALLSALGVEPVEPGVRRPGTGLVVLDQDCPFTTPAAVRRVVEAALAVPGCAVGVRPVTDTMKRLHDGLLGETVDREALVAVAAPLVVPLVVPPGVNLPSGLDGLSLPELVASLRVTTSVELVEVDALSRRVADASDRTVLAALARAAR